VTLLHVPYTLWHLAYVVIGAALAPELLLGRLGVTLAAFFLGLGVAAHALDELHGRPLGTSIPQAVLVTLASTSLTAAIGLGIYATVAYTAWLAPLVAFGGFLAVAYNLELFGGRLHGDAWFALSWGALPVVAAYLAQTGRIRTGVLFAAGFALFLSAAQRRLSTEVRLLRRRTRSATLVRELEDGAVETLGTDSLIALPEGALRLLAVAVVALATGLALLHV
jgi:hypothetical protein